MTFDTKVSFNAAALREKFAKKIHRAQMKLDVQIVNDSNYYCPTQEHILANSGISKTVAGSGNIRWVTDYARRQYYGINFDHSKSDNPNATAKWFESAKARKLKQWEKLVDDEIRHS